MRKKQAYENFIRELGLLPNHNFIAVSRAEPNLFTYAKGSAFTNFLSQEDACCSLLHLN